MAIRVVPVLPWFLSYGGHGEMGKHGGLGKQGGRRGVSIGCRGDLCAEQVCRSLPNPLAKCRRLG